MLLIFSVEPIELLSYSFNKEITKKASTAPVVLSPGVFLAFPCDDQDFNEQFQEMHMALVRWYWEMTKGQRTLCWLVSLGCSLIYGIGIAMVVLLLYAHLGKSKYYM